MTRRLAPPRPSSVLLAFISTVLPAWLGLEAEAAVLQSGGLLLPTENDVTWYRNPRDLDMYADVVMMPATGLLMPTVRPSNRVMQKYEIQGGFGKCLDGSNPVYYLSYGEQSMKWMIFLEGGDWCTRYEDTGDKDAKRNCVQRRDKPGLQGGTTREDPAELSQSSLGADYGQLDPDPARNPLMHNWNKVYVRNCDGSSFTSGRTDVVRQGGKLIYFRGKYILEDVIGDLLANRYLGYATDVVVTGCSAGGLAVYLHTDMIIDTIVREAQMLGRRDTDQIKAVALADSGFFLYHAGGPGDCNFIQRMQFISREMNITAGLQPRCVATVSVSDQYKCLFAETAILFTEAPTFTLQSIQDGWQLAWIGCGDYDPSALSWYGSELSQSLALASSSPKNGGFFDACLHHCHCYENIVIDGDNQAQAFQKFYNGSAGGRRIWQSTTCRTELGGECPVKNE